MVLPAIVPVTEPPLSPVTWRAFARAFVTVFPVTLTSMVPPVEVKEAPRDPAA